MLLKADSRAPETVNEVLKVEDLVPAASVAYTPKVYAPRAIFSTVAEYAPLPSAVAVTADFPSTSTVILARGEA